MSTAKREPSGQSTKAPASASASAQTPGVRYVIRSRSEGEPDLDGQSGAFWSNDDGWGSLASATNFNTVERMQLNLPRTAGGDAEWMLLEEAEDLAKQAPAPSAGS